MMTDHEARRAYEAARSWWLQNRDGNRGKRQSPLTPTLLTALYECEHRYHLLRTYKPGAYKKNVSPEAKQGIAVHAKRERFLKQQLRQCFGKQG